MSFKKTARTLLYITVGLIVFIFLLQAAANYYINRHLADDLKERVSKGTNGEYKLDMKAATISFFGRSIRLDSISLQPSPCNDCNIQKVKVTAEYIALSGVDIIKLVKNKAVLASSLDVGSLNITVFRPKDPMKKDTTKIRLSLYKILSPKVSEVRVSDIDISDTHFHVFKGMSDTAAILGSDHNDIHIHNFIVNKQADSLGNFFLAGKFSMTMQSFNYRMDNKLFWLTGKKMSIDYSDSIITVDTVALIPRYSKKELGKAAGKRFSWTKLKVNGIELQGINPRLFFQRGWLVSHKLKVAGMDLDMYVDMNMPHKQESKPTIQEMIKSVPFFLKIDTIDLGSSHVSYSMLANGAVQPGSVSFYKLSGRAIGVRNDSTHGNRDKLYMYLKTSFMNEGDITATYIFPLDTRHDVYECTGRVGAMSLTRTSNVLKRLINISIRKGQLDSVLFSYKTNGETATGWMKFLYHDLEVDLVEKNTDKQKLKQKLLTFFANEFVIKNQNPLPGKDIRVTGIDYKLDHTRYLFFNSWKALQSAILPAIGLKNAKLVTNNAKK